MMITLAARKHTMMNIIVHDELVVDEQRIEEIRKVEDGAVGLGCVCELKCIRLYINDLLLIADGPLEYQSGRGDSGETVLTELRGHSVSGMRK